jgi:multiple sugar transport system permease protein
MKEKKLRWNIYTMNKVLSHGVLGIIAVLFILPLLWMLVASFDADANFVIKMPNLTLQNFVDVMTNQENQHSFGVGLFISFMQAIFVVIASVLAAYPLSRYQVKFKKPFMYTILFMTGLPITAVMVPVYQLFLYMKLTDSIWGTICFFTASSLPYAVWMMKNFMDSVPMELEESAWVDGASILTGLRKVVAPIMIPGIFTVFIYTFSRSWGNFFVPYILLSSPEKVPASVKIYQFFGMYGQVEYGPLAAFSLLYTLPSIILYILGQRYMSEGFSMGGATKG